MVEKSPMQRDSEIERCELAIAMRRLALKGRRLAVPTDVIPGEDFRDILFRAAVNNGHQTLTTLARLVGLKFPSTLSRHVQVAEEVDPAHVADILGTPNGREDIESLMFGRGRQGRRLLFFGREIGVANFVTGRRVSPLALKESLHYKAIWRLRAFSFDPVTRETLISKCPSCGEPLTYKFTWGIERCDNAFDLEGNDARCVNVDLRDYAQPPLPVEDEEALRFFVALIDPQQSPSAATTRLHPKFGAYGPGQIFELIFSLAKMYVHVVLDETPDGAKRRKGLRSMEVGPNELALAARAILGWPEMYHNFSEKLRLAYIGKFQVGGKPHHWHPLKRIYAPDENIRAMLLAEAERARHKTYYSETGQRIRTAFSASDATYPIIRPHRDPRVDVNLLRRNSRNRIDPNAFAVDGPLFDPVASPRFNIAQLFRTSDAIKSFSRQVGIPVPLVPDLYRRNIVEVLDPLLEPLVDRVGDAPDDHLIDRVTRIAEDGSPPYYATPLSSTCSALTVRPINPWPLVLEAILNRRLKVWLGAKSAPNFLTRLHVADYGQLRSLLDAADNASDLAEMRTSTREVAMVLGLSATYVVRLYDCDILPRMAKLDHAWTFHQKYITLKEILLRCGLLGECKSYHSYVQELNAAGIDIIRHLPGQPLQERRMVESYFGDRLVLRV